MTDGTANDVLTVRRTRPVSSMTTALPESSKLMARAMEMTASGSHVLPFNKSTRPCKINPSLFYTARHDAHTAPARVSCPEGGTRRFALAGLPVRAIWAF